MTGGAGLVTAVTAGLFSLCTEVLHMSLISSLLTIGATVAIFSFMVYKSGTLEKLKTCIGIGGLVFLACLVFLVIPGMIWHILRVNVLHLSLGQGLLVLALLLTVCVLLCFCMIKKGAKDQQRETEA